MNIISTGGADAVTIDGANWTPYIHDNFDCPTDDPKDFFEIEMPDIRFGDWNKQSSLKHNTLSYECYAYRQVIGGKRQSTSSYCTYTTHYLMLT